MRKPNSVRNDFKTFQNSISHHISKGIPSFKIIHAKILNYINLELMIGHQQIRELSNMLIEYLKRIYESEIEIYELERHSLTIILLKNEEWIHTQDNFNFFFKSAFHRNSFPLLLKYGWATYPDDDPKGDLLLAKANLAVDSICADPGQFWCAYHPRFLKKTGVETDVHLSLCPALKEKEISVCYQPQVDIRSKQIVGFEVLCRWYSPTLGTISPTTFIPIAQRYGYMPELDAYIIKLVFADYDKIQMRFPAASISINVSYYAMQAEAFFTLVIQAIKTYRVVPQHITFELTEDQPIFNKYRLIKQIKKFKKLGFKISLDDFGTGHNNLSRLFELPVEEVKIDSRFFRTDFGEKSKAIIISIITLAKNLNLKVIAEGVEEHSQKEFLLENNCFIIQGYLYYRPMGISEILKI
ncbi:MAG TPA: EAL domain-containing protein [Bacilli bacterium]|nr:EAL domain-containing protein [Bacilli bacterium]